MSTSDDSLKSLIAQRAVLKSKLTKFKHFLDSFEPGHSISLLRVKRDRIQSIISDFNQIQFQIEYLDKDTARQQNEREYFDETCDECLAIAEDIIKSSETASRAPINHQNSNSELLQIKLPTIDLPPFNGQYSQWLTFFETFDSLINKNDKLSNIQKFHYLKSSLKGDASKIIESISISDANYAHVWDLLKTRYENKRIIIKTHVLELLNLPNTNKNDPVSLRKLLDTATTNLKILKNLGLPTEEWAVLVIYIMIAKFDFHTKLEWEQSQREDIPSFSEFSKFITNRCQMLEAMDFSKQKTFIANSNKPYQHKISSHMSINKPFCHFCKQAHFISQCAELLKLPIDNRIQEIKLLYLCTNCLKKGHSLRKCPSKFYCKSCRKPHHTILHRESVNDNTDNIETIPRNNNEQVETETPLAQPSVSAINNFCRSPSNNFQVLLSTAIINVFDSRGQIHDCRALIDVGSQSNFITENMTQKLGLNLKSVNITIGGISQSANKISKSATLKIKSRVNAFSSNIDCLVLSKITENLPLVSFSVNKLNIPPNITLADPNFNVSSEIDLLLGADIFWSMLCVGQIKTAKNCPYLHKTQLGWVVGGKIPIENSLVEHLAHVSVNTLQKQVNKFWDLEEPKLTADNLFSRKDNITEQHFLNNVERSPSGRFVVKLPLVSNKIEQLGSTRDIALKRFISLEHKLNNNPTLRIDYNNFMREYLNLGHMEIVPKNEITLNRPTYYLPHHAIIKESSITTKLRVVFDGSAKSTTGISLNDVLMVGPNIQQDLFCILLRFRTYKYVLSADIEKMYRQILVNPDNRDLQRIFWRFDSNNPIETYRLKTVTYGTASASFLAIRTLHQLAFDVKDNYKLAHDAILNDFYVDDLLTGADSFDKSINIRDQLINALQTGGFELKKWASNCVELLPKNSEPNAIISLDKQGELKTLGSIWNCHQDTLHYSIKNTGIATNNKVTKRSILSTIAQIFDPLGLVSPVIISAKIMLQTLWSLKLSWDESVPIAIHSQWTNFIKNLSLLNNLSISRYVHTTSDRSYELHGFCDSSERAYAACIYVRVRVNGDNYVTNLICSKSRVAPLKPTTLPRLELCGALLLSRLTNKVAKILNISLENCYCWTDSTIVLAWIAGPANKWQTFVANRVGNIQSLTNPNNWRHIESERNPADLPSRGINAVNLLNSGLWWNGPSPFPQNYISQPINLSPVNPPEQRKQIFITTVSQESAIFQKFSSFSKLQRVIAFCLRFIKNCKLKSSKITGFLTTQELHNAELVIIKGIQKANMADDLLKLIQRRPLANNSKLLTLSPFLDDDGILRVGGRLKNAHATYNVKYPILLPRNSFVTKLILKSEHERTLHAGPQATLAAIRRRYWPINGKSLVRKIIFNCVTCFKANPRSSITIMGNLPSKRLERPLRPFINCGLDFAGPITIKNSFLNNRKNIKGYIALFICFATKAIHLELVTNLSSEAFLSALKRFISRRGNITNIYSDNATNFVGADREMRDLFVKFKNQANCPTLINELTKQNITWHFIPPRSPHFGGLWEAGVKSVKGHLRRMLRNEVLTYEELYTLLTQIEACLNSRPLTPLSSSPNDLDPLTPGHFLIGDALTSPAEPDLQDIKYNKLSRWQRLEQLRQHFWRRWSNEYIHTLIQRSKWTTNRGPKIEVDDLVLIKEENQPPLNWALGRVVELNRGSDGIVRVVSVKTKNGILKRACAKLCALPKNTE